MPYQTGIPYIDTLLSSLQPHWNGVGSFNSSSVITYSFVEDQGVYNSSTSPDIETVDFSPFSSAQRAASRDAFHLWSTVANITFVEVNDTAESHGDIRLLNSNDIIGEFGAAGVSFLPVLGPAEDRQSAENEVLGDIVIAPGSDGTQDFSEFGFGRYVLIHEIGHALGLNHPNNEDSLASIPSGFNNDRYTIMTTPDTSASPNAFGNNIFATSPMLYDIAAIQHLYGANLATNSGDTVHSFPANDTQIRVIWDAGGVDTIDVSTHVRNTIINLNQGMFSSMYPYPANPAAFPILSTVQNIGIAYGVFIENAIGGAGSDLIIGNELDNYLVGGTGNDFSGDHLIGGDGNDILDGGHYTDRMEGGKGNDIYYVNDVAEQLIELPDEGYDIIYSSAIYYSLPNNIERAELTGSSNSTIFGNEGNNVLIGNTGNNNIWGGGGDDYLDGGPGEDTLTGGRGNDVYLVDNINDIVIETSDFPGVVDLIISYVDVSLPVYVENLTLYGTANLAGSGNYDHNVITGNSGNNHLSGHGGRDTLIGGPGDDVLDGGTQVNFPHVIYGGGLLDAGSVDQYIVKYAGDGTRVSLGVYVPYTQGYYDPFEPVRDFVVDENKNIYIFNGTFQPVLSVYKAETGTLEYFTPADWGIINSVILGDIEKYGNYIYVNDFSLYGEADLAGVLRFDINSETFVRFAHELDDNIRSLAVDAEGHIYVVTAMSANIIHVYDPITLTSYKTITLDSDVMDIAIDENGFIYGTGGYSVHFASLYSEIPVDEYGYIFDGSQFLLKKFNSSGDLLVETSVPASNILADLDVSGDGYVMVSSVNGGAVLLNSSLQVISVIPAGLFVAFGEKLDDSFKITDTVSYKQTTGAVVVNLHTGFASGADGNDTLIEMENIEGSEFNDQLTGKAGPNRIYGFAGDDLIDGGADNDFMSGGMGNDTYWLDTLTDIVVELVNEGDDTIRSTVTLTLPDNIEHLVLLAANLTGTGNTLANTITGSEGNDTLFGQDNNDTLIGNAGDDILNGGAGIDTLIGGTGNDSYWLSVAADVVIENVDEGQDTVYSPVSYTLLDHVENLVLTAPGTSGTGNSLFNTITGSTGNDALYGMAGNDTLTGNAGHDVLDGGAGNDVMSGGTGNDTYLVDVIDDVVLELADGGVDTVTSKVSYVLSDHLENLVIATVGMTGTGNGLANILSGGSGGSEFLYGMGGDDTLVGNSGSDLLDGGDGNDILNGGAGVDTLIGGAGDDTYYVDRLTDSVSEFAGQGIDHIISSINYTLSVHVENLTLQSGTAVTGTGNDLGNVLTGNENHNQLSGMAGGDILAGLAGDDILNGGRGYDDLRGGEGDDYLVGGYDSNLMSGGTGNDTYVVRRGDGDGIGRDGVNEDHVFELSDEGIDTVESHVYSFILPDHVENLWLVGAYALKGFGNSLDNTLTGNAAQNLLEGGEGNDILLGEGGKDKLYGGAGNDLLNGGAASDSLTGGIGEDLFVFDSLGSIDIVVDFLAGVDRLLLSLGTFEGIGTTGSLLGEGTFKAGISPVAGDGDDHILYNSQTGALYYDADGNGIELKVQFALLAGSPVLVASDIWVIA